MTLDKESKSKLIEEFARHDGDTGSPEVQVAILTSRINQLYRPPACQHSRRVFPAGFAEVGWSTPPLAGIYSPQGFPALHGSDRPPEHPP